ncbi:DUF4365 domain-containing protein [Adhaeribacter swui]|uniref:DUF4365 domain-containing protein n=1 Tax=Adhaeribacter swui TaxID=2086471 RepID=UPI001E4BC99F|nr:DUF4365 domain-containing protein [Adhaeribacter swui]
MVNKKRRVFQHIMEDESYQIIKNLIPKEWVIREFNRPDYGIDLVIELFEKIDDHYSETLGEFIYVQVKSLKNIKIVTEKIFSVNNVAKGVWGEDRSEYAEIDIKNILLILIPFLQYNHWVQVFLFCFLWLI